MSNNILFISPALLKSRTAISSSIDDDILKSQIKLAQDIYVQPALGSTLYLRLQTGVSDSGLTPNEKTLINTYITDSLIWYTMSLLPFALGYQVFAKGVLQKTSEESNAPTRADLELISSQHKQSAEFYKQRLINYLRQNYTLYAQYMTPGEGLDVIFPEKKSFTCPIYLGPAKKDEECSIPFYGSGTATAPSYTKEVIPATGVSTFEVSELTNATVIRVVRGGLSKGIAREATTNTQYIQVNGATVTLPTGDVTGEGELFIFEYR